MEVEDDDDALLRSPLQFPESRLRGELGASVLGRPSDSVNTELRSLSELFDLWTGFLSVPIALNNKKFIKVHRQD